MDLKKAAKAALDAMKAAEEAGHEAAADALEAAAEALTGAAEHVAKAAEDGGGAAEDDPPEDKEAMSEKEEDKEAMEDEDKDEADGGTAPPSDYMDDEKESSASAPTTKVARAAVGLLPPSFDFGAASDVEIMRAALKDEVNGADSLPVSELTEKFVATVERRNKAQAALDRLAKGDEKAKAKFQASRQTTPRTPSELFETASFQERRKARVERSMRKADAHLDHGKEG